MTPTSPLSFLLQRLMLAAVLTSSVAVLSGCSTASMVLSVAGVATDTSVSWEIAKHLHAKATEGDPVACFRLNTVERAVSGRCGSFVPGSLRSEDLVRHELQTCPLSIAARDPALWRVMPEMISKGAQPEACAVPPLVALAESHPCAALGSAGPEVHRAIVWLAEGDARSVHHDVVRLLSCPSAQSAGLDKVLDTWRAAGSLDRGATSFGVLGALHPHYLSSPFVRKLEAQGHAASASLVPFAGRQPFGFEEALRLGHHDALQWWLNRAPQLIHRVPGLQNGQAAWSPLARTLQPGFLADAATQQATLEFLLARGADPWKPVPSGAFKSVVAYARYVQSPHVALLDPPVRIDTPLTTPRRMLADRQERPAESLPGGDRPAGGAAVLRTR